MRHATLPLSLAILAAVQVNARTDPSSSLWHPLPADATSGVAHRYIVPDHYLAFTLDVEAMRAFLAGTGVGTVQDLSQAQRVLTLPMADGSWAQFRFLETPTMEEGLQRRYPEIRTYTGTDVQAPLRYLKFDLTPGGFHAMVLDPVGGDVFIDPIALGDATHYQVYFRRDHHARLPAGASYCAYTQVNDLDAARTLTEQWIHDMGEDRAGDCHFRGYRLALACTGEYANFFGATGGNKAPALAAMVTSMARVNGIYERDMTLSMTLIANDDQLIYTDPDTDPYTNDDGATMLGENISNLNAVIGSSAYDIGHVFSTGGGGIAYLQSVCTGNKAGGVTGLSAPVGDPFDIDYVCHEMGHQFGGNHTQNNDCNRAASASVEVGSGITIMGYAGVCAPDVAAHSDAMFGGYSLQEMHAFVTSAGHTCDAVSALVNMPPTANAGADYTIPRSTPFVLTGTATDPNSGDALTYSWEQMDPAVSTQPPVATNTGGPSFRPFLPATTPVRYMPNLPAVLAGTTPTWEVLGSVARTYNFRFTVRDNAVGGGCNAQDNMVVTVNGTAGPFVVTQPNTAVSWAALSAQTVTWNVAGTTANNVNCANVDILLSTDGGTTWPYTLATATPNDGTQSITLPNVTSTTARVMVRANGNIFYDVSNVNFTITAPVVLRVSPKLWLEGPYVDAAGLMHDSLRVKGLVPLTEPYTALGYAHVGGGGETTTSGVLAVSGSNAIVDWVVIELRSSGSPATVVATKSALVQRDGDVVGTDGTSAVQFSVAAGSYYVAVRHRNHLGCMTAATVALSSTTTTVDMRSLASGSIYGTNARKAVGTTNVLWQGNALRDTPLGTLAYTGGNNDRDAILVRVGGTTPNQVVNGYFLEDTNMDGAVRYTGAANDRDPVLVNVGGSTPNNTRVEQLP